MHFSALSSFIANKEARGSDKVVGHFRVAPSLFFKTRVSAKSDMKIIFYSHGSKTHFHMKGFALGLILK